MNRRDRRSAEKQARKLGLKVLEGDGPPKSPSQRFAEALRMFTAAYLGQYKDTSEIEIAVVMMVAAAGVAVRTDQPLEGFVSAAEQAWRRALEEPPPAPPEKTG